MKRKSQNSIDIIIPCLNEAKYLSNTLMALRRLAEDRRYEFTCILMDNGSTDNSCQIAKDHEISCKVTRSATIAGLRNEGISYLSGEFLVFLDADIEITSSWEDSIRNFVETTPRDKLIITGYPCRSSIDGSWIEKHWFHGNQTVASYINSGNLITTRYLFERIDGFNEQLKTGEDWDFCQRAKKIGATVVLNSDFKVYHHGYPKNLKEFFLREAWHGLGDCKDVKFFLRSKPALLSVLSGIFLMLWMIGVFKAPLYSTFTLLVFMLIIAIGLSVRRSNRLWQVPGNIIIALAYVYGRLASLFISIWQRIRKSSTVGRFRWR
jgi:glycosyltransferase involved in cell wall biosynthesis